MNLLITTQMVDREDPILGFFHGWLVALSPHFAHIHVICLKEGTHALPENITVHSLGKEHGENRLLYVLRFFRYVWQLRNEYDAVYSHMNPHYIVLAGLFWKWRGVRMYLWRNHALMNIKTRIAAWFSERVFYTSPYACTRTFAHAVQMPVGIDTNIFHPEQNIIPEERSVLFLGRLSGVKRPELFVEATNLLTDFGVHIYGDEPGGSTSYRRALEVRAGGRITFHRFPRMARSHPANRTSGPARAAATHAPMVTLGSPRSMRCQVTRDMPAACAAEVADTFCCLRTARSRSPRCASSSA